MQEFQDEISTPFGEVYHLTGDRELAAKAQSDFKTELKIRELKQHG